MSESLAFDLNAEQPEPNCYIQWKGTDVCMDFHCECGSHHHIDAMFVYYIKCSDCGSLYEMPQHIYPRKVEDTGQTTRFVTEPDDEPER